MNRISLLTAAGDAAGALGNAIDLARGMIARLSCLHSRGIAPGDLDERILRDIGLTRAEVLASRFRAGHTD
jgi:hypothetical protein